MNVLGMPAPVCSNVASSVGDVAADPVRPFRRPAILMWLLTLALLQPACAANLFIDDLTVSTVAVNGGTDATNAGTTCFLLSVPVSSTCTGGWIAVRNNNRQLLATLLQAKGTSARAMIWYNDAAGSNHCPWLGFTPCVVDSIALK